MSGDTPERLKEFRAQYKTQSTGDRWPWVLLGVTVAGFAAVVALLLVRPTPTNAPTATHAAGMDAQSLREYAVYLTQKNEPGPAITVYRRYLDAADLSRKERATVCYSVAKLAIDAERYEDALPYLYEAEFLDPESELKGEIGQKVVLCLDKLGRSVDLRKELRKRTEVKRTAQDVGEDEAVLAEFAGEVLTDRDLDNEVEKLPQAVRDGLRTPEKKVELLKQMVAQRLLLDKARRLELDKDAEIQDQLVKQLDAMIVNKLIQNEVEAQIKVTPEDIERFYKAEPSLFTEPAKAEVVMASAPTEEEAKAATDFSAKPVTVRAGGPVPGAPAGLDASKEILAADVDAVVGPLEADSVWYVFKVTSKTPEKLHPLEEVKDQAERMYRMRKEQEAVSALIDETLQARDVRIYPERLQPAEATP